MKYQLLTFLKKFSLTVVSLLFLDFFLKLFVCQTDNFGTLTKSSIHWNERYWKPINRFGFRDKEHTFSTFSHKKIVLVLGDSFAAGAGIKDYRKRFGDIVQANLGNQWDVFIVAQPGWDTDKELDALGRFALKPDIIIFSYFLNDIADNVMRHQGQYQPYRIKFPRGPLRWLVEHSEIVNFLYWRFYRFNYSALGEHQKQSLMASYDDPLIWKDQERDLMKIISFSHQKEARLIVVLFPMLNCIQDCKNPIAKLVHLFQENGISVIDVGEMVKDKPPLKLIVNPMDFHPNEYVHNQVAVRILEEINRAPDRKSEILNKIRSQ